MKIAWQHPKNKTFIMTEEHLHWRGRNCKKC